MPHYAICASDSYRKLEQVFTDIKNALLASLYSLLGEYIQSVNSQLAA